MDREEMERLQPAVYNGVNYVAGETKEHAQLEEASQKDLDLDRANKKIESLMVSLEKAEIERDELREELLVKKSVQVGEIELYNIGNLALIDDLKRANRNIESLMVSLEKAETRNDQIRDELLTKAVVENELENAHEEIRILEKRLERVAGDLLTANETLLEKSDLLLVLL
ncbi:tropomyosin-like [Palaemon carinicauda]|uniref:tropomyosin-like n=1 Tax=Palaemon carinicauda TaxID=392227 RepID=UPI0035B5F488